jgi:hypothetical protein
MSLTLGQDMIQVVAEHYTHTISENGLKNTCMRGLFVKVDLTKLPLQSDSYSPHKVSGLYVYLKRLIFCR